MYFAAVASGEACDKTITLAHAETGGTVEMYDEHDGLECLQIVKPENDETFGLLLKLGGEISLPKDGDMSRIYGKIIAFQFANIFRFVALQPNAYCKKQHRRSMLYITLFQFVRFRKRTAVQRLCSSMLSDIDLRQVMQRLERKALRRV